MTDAPTVDDGAPLVVGDGPHLFADGPGVRTTLGPIAGDAGDVVLYLQQHGVTVHGAGMNGDGTAFVVDADQDVTDLLASYTPPAKPTLRDHLNAAIEARDALAAIARLADAVKLADGS